MIKSYFNDLEKDYIVEYADEDEPLGTTHALLGEEDVEFGKDLEVGLDPVISVGGRCSFR